MDLRLSGENIKVGSLLPCTALSSFTIDGFLEINAVNGFGLHPDRPDVHDNHPQGMTMWLGRCTLDEDPEIVFDFGAVYPVGEMHIWNYNSCGERGAECGIREAAIDFSVDCRTWHALSADDTPWPAPFEFARANGKPDLEATNIAGKHPQPVNFNGVSARYIRIRPTPEIGKGNWGAADDEGRMLFGLSEVRFYADSGFTIREEPVWTGLFKRYEGWTGGDGIFSIPFNGDERPGSCATDKTLLLFSDTFIGSVDKKTGRRTCVMPNNTLAVLKGDQPDPEQIQFIYRRSPSGKPGTVFDPPGIDHFELAGKRYFWLQDGIIIDDTLYVTALNVYHDPEKPEGLLFGVDGVSLIHCPMTSEGPDIDSYTVSETPLYHAFQEGEGARGGGTAYVGCGIFPNTVSAGAPNPDGYIYVYGYINKDGRSDLIASRVEPACFGSFADWEFYCGDEAQPWCRDLSSVAVITENVSHELSVSPLPWDSGKYILISQKDIAGHLITYRIGETPVGPFGEMADLYHTDEWLKGEGITTYNAKAHPHLSKPDELLVSYNVNTLSTDTHIKNGDVYRPRFIAVKEIK